MPPVAAGHAPRVGRRGLLLVLSSPSGAGKTTLARRLLAADPGIRMSVSVTTRKPRPGEVHGVDYYFVDKTEFEPRIVGLRQRLSQLQERHQAALEAAATERDLALVISRLEDFSAKVAKGIDNLDWIGMQHIIRTVVRRIEIDDTRIEVIFRVPPPDGPPGPR